MRCRILIHFFYEQFKHGDLFRRHPGLEKSYENAVVDAMKAEESELMPLVTLTEEDPLANCVDGKYELVTLHKYPSSYPVGENVTLSWGEVWVTSLPEFNAVSAKLMENYGDLHGANLDQVLGMPWDFETMESSHTHISVFSVSLQDVFRPAFVKDPTQQVNHVDYWKMSEEEGEEHRNWFANNAYSSYMTDSTYPWTRLGYTYNWDPVFGNSEYGLTEFIVKAGATVTVKSTDTVHEYGEKLRAR